MDSGRKMGEDNSLGIFLGLFMARPYFPRYLMISIHSWLLERWCTISMSLHNLLHLFCNPNFRKGNAIIWHNWCHHGTWLAFELRPAHHQSWQQWEWDNTWFLAIESMKRQNSQPHYTSGGSRVLRRILCITWPTLSNLGDRRNTHIY